MKQILLISTLFIVFLSCSNCPIYKNLQEIETIMETHPDSALSLLQAIDTEAIATDRCRALHSLLLSQAYDRNYIDLTNDSIITIAVDYFADSDDDHHYAMLAHYYHGRIFENTHKYHKAIIEFTKAEQLAKYSDDNLAIGLIYTHLGDAYNEYYDFEKSAKSFLVASEYYDRANKLHHKLYALSDLTEAYINNLEYDKASEILNQLIKEANDSCNHAMIQIGMLDLISLYSAQNKHSELLDLYNSLIAKYPNVKLRSTTYMCVAKACAYAGRHNEINSYITKAWNVSMHRADTILIQINASAIYELLKQYEPALKSLKYGGIKQDSSVRLMLTQPILTAQRDLYRAELELNKLKQQHQLHTSILIGGIIIIVFVLLVYRWNKKYKQKLAKNITIAQNLREIMQTKASETQHIINNLLASRFDVIDGLCKTIYENRGTGLDKKKISAEIEKLIKQFSSDSQKIAELETFANEHYSNIITSFKTDLPNLKEADYLLFLYTTLGFSITAIALFLNEEKVDAVYNRKARLKNKIRNLGTSKYELYAKYLQ